MRSAAAFTVAVWLVSSLLGAPHKPAAQKPAAQKRRVRRQPASRAQWPNYQHNSNFSPLTDGR